MSLSGCGHGNGMTPASKSPLVAGKSHESGHSRVFGKTTGSGVGKCVGEAACKNDEESQSKKRRREDLHGMPRRLYS